MVLEQGIVEGRKTYANMIKYIKMTASLKFRKYVLSAGGFCIAAIPPDDEPAADTS